MFWQHGESGLIHRYAGVITKRVWQPSYKKKIITASQSQPFVQEIIKKLPARRVVKRIIFPAPILLMAAKTQTHADCPPQMFRWQMCQRLALRRLSINPVTNA